MLNSQRVNTDPKPWKLRFCDHGTRGSDLGEVFDLCDYGYGVENMADHLPRPEFDNNPNPILVEFRTSWQDDREHHEQDIVLAADRFIASCCDEELAADYYTEAEREHARKVLTRLANLGD